MRTGLQKISTVVEVKKQAVFIILTFCGAIQKTSTRNEGIILLNLVIARVVMPTTL